MSKLDTKGIIDKMFLSNSKKRVKRSPEFIGLLLKSGDKMIAEAQDKARIRCA